ncbi:hypothetical protein HO875_04065 [Streptococcus suis]|nr:hypothetical protein [Streptococcus suis]
MKVRRSEFLFYIAYTMYYIMNMLYTTRIGSLFGVISLNDLSLIVTPIVLGCLLVTFLKSISKRHWFLFGLIFIVAVVTTYSSGARAMLISVMFILCASRVDLDDLCRFTFKMNTSMILLVIALSIVGLIPGEIVTRGSMIRYSLGFASSNTLAIAVLKSVLLYYITRYERIKFRNLIGMAVFLAFTYYLTDSRLFALIGCVFLALTVYEMINPNAFSSKRVLVIGEAVLPIFTIATLYYGSVYWIRHDELLSLNELFSGRLYFINYFLTEYGISTWGQKIEFTTVRDSLASGGTWFALDNSYAYALVCYGVVFFAIMAVAYLLEIFIMYKNQRKEIFIYLLCMLVIGLTENGIFDVTFNFALIYLVKVLVSDKSIIRNEARNS